MQLNKFQINILSAYINKLLSIVYQYIFTDDDEVIIFYYLLTCYMRVCMQ